MKLLLDTNIVLDLLIDRQPFVDDAAEIFSKIEDGKVIGYLCATTVTTIHYLTARSLGKSVADTEIRKLLALFEVAFVNRLVIDAALSSAFNDFEDAVIHEAACNVRVDALVTRNQKDFVNSKIPVYSSEDMVKILASY